MNIEEYSEALDKATLQLNSGLELIADRFIAMGLSVRAEVRISETRLLGYGKKFKNAKTWRLYLRTNEPGSDEQNLLECSRKLRMEAVPHLGALRDALVEASKSQLQDVQNAVSELQAFIQTL